MAPWQVSRRLVGVERDAVRPRQPARLRPMGGSGQPWLGLRRRAALLQKVAGHANSSLQGLAVPQRGRAVERGKFPLPDAHRQGLPGGGRRNGLPGARHKRRQADWIHQVARHPARRTPLQHGQGVSQVKNYPRKSVNFAGYVLI